MPGNILRRTAANAPKRDTAYWNDLALLAVDDEAALTELYNHFFPLAYKYLLSRVRNDDIADDLISNVFMKMYEHLSEFDPQKASFSTWLTRIEENEVRMYLRSRGRRDERETEWDEDYDPPAQEETQPEKQVLQKERAQELRAAIMTLPDRERRIIEMTYWLNLTPKEIAESLEMTPNHVSVSLRRAKQMLRERLSA